jgi:hypothetical protein
LIFVKVCTAGALNTPGRCRITARTPDRIRT